MASVARPIFLPPLKSNTPQGLAAWLPVAYVPSPVINVASSSIPTHWTKSSTPASPTTSPEFDNWVSGLKPSPTYDPKDFPHKCDKCGHPCYNGMFKVEYAPGHSCK